MFDTYLSIARDLLAYREFHGLILLLQAVLWLCLLAIVVVVLLHVLYLLGYQSPLYKKRSPRANWSRRFFGSSLLVGLLILLVLRGCEWVGENIVVDRTLQSVIHW